MNQFQDPVTITQVEPGSPAERAGIRAGDGLISIDGHEITDVLDYRFYLTVCRPQLVLQRGGEPYTVRLKKGEYDDAGLSFGTYLMDEHRRCSNGCIFCFIDQMPRGMRDTLYFKDDDSRLSFLQGNYITLTNLDERDVSRIIEMHLSPVRISVHTTDPALRVQMMKNRRAGEVLAYMQRFADAGLQLDCQIVLCRTYNDGAALDRTLRDLAALGEGLHSVSVVPAGLTKCREGLTPLSPFSAEECRAVIDRVERAADESLAARGTRVFYCSDEWYLLAGKETPPGSYYEDYAQIENGVGMLSSLHDEITEELPFIPESYDTEAPRTVSVATGMAAYGTLSRELARIEACCPGLTVHCYAIRNDFFGESVTVAGLITGGDLCAQLAGKPLGTKLILPDCMLRHGETVFLDDVTLAQVEQSLSVAVRTNDGSGADLIRALLTD